MSYSPAARFAGTYPVLRPTLATDGSESPETYLYSTADLPPVPPVQTGTYRPAWNFRSANCTEEITKDGEVLCQGRPIGTAHYAGHMTNMRAQLQSAEDVSRAALPREGYVNPAMISGTATGPATGTATAPADYDATPLPHMGYDADKGGYVDLDEREVY